MVIPDDDMHQSEGDQGALKHPVVQVKSVSKPPPGCSYLGGFVRVSRYQTPPCVVSQGPVRPNTGPFVPKWNLYKDSRLYV